jgi:hypothetical protein
MDRSSVVVLLMVFILFILSGLLDQSFAWTTLCGRSYIEGLDKEHEMGLKVLGKGLVHQADKMSVYITVQDRGGEKTLYLQSNYSYKNNKNPQKIGTDEEVDLLTLLGFIHDPDKGTPFNADHLTFYVDPRFLNDPVWGKFQDEMGGTIHVLGPDGKTVKTYSQERKPYKPPPLQIFIPPGWVDAKTGSPEFPLSKIPKGLKDAAAQTDCKLFAFDPQGLKGGEMATMTLEEKPLGNGRLMFIASLEKATKEMAESNDPKRKLLENKVYTMKGKMFFRVIVDRKNPDGSSTRLLQYYFVDGYKGATLTFMTDSKNFQKYSRLFQDSFAKTLE